MAELIATGETPDLIEPFRSSGSRGSPRGREGGGGRFALSRGGRRVLSPGSAPGARICAWTPASRRNVRRPDYPRVPRHRMSAPERSPRHPPRAFRIGLRAAAYFLRYSISVSHMTVTTVLSGPSFFGQSEGGDDVGRRSRAREQAFFAGEPEGHGHGVFLDTRRSGRRTPRAPAARRPAPIPPRSCERLAGRPTAPGIGGLHGDDPDRPPMAAQGFRRRPQGIRLSSSRSGRSHRSVPPSGSRSLPHAVKTREPGRCCSADPSRSPRLFRDDGAASIMSRVNRSVIARRSLGTMCRRAPRIRM